MAYPIFKKTFIHSSLILTTLCTTYAIAQDVIVDDSTDLAEELVKREGKTTLLEDTVPTSKVSNQEVNQALKRQAQTDVPQRFDLEELKSNPLLFTKFLNAAIAAQDMNTVSKLLPHYKAMQIKDPSLIAFADALVYRSKGENKKAVEIYKSMLAENPDFHPVRLNLAKALYADKQYRVAKNQFLKLQAADLPEPIQNEVQGWIHAIDRQEEWNLNASLNYLKDDNLNGAPSESMQSSFGRTRRDSGEGLQLSGSATKRFNLSKNFYATVGANASLKGYFEEASKYNDYLLTTTIGAGYDDAKNDASITPFITKRYYSEDPYSWRKGVTVKASRWLKPKIRVTATGIVSNETFDEEKDKNRETDGRFIGLNALYTKDATQYFYGGVGNYRNDVPKSSIISYDRNSINAGWGREWHKGISTLTTVSYAQKDYDKPSDSFSDPVALKGYYASFGGDFGDTREDKTTSLGFQVWKRDLNWYGLTPRLVLNFDKTSSNFKYYDDREDKSATVLLSKSF